ncbi:MAG: hypothetical protein Q8903_11245 [Bacteroidota bacterium]|nr:hypothetical protein [Bacteroidota bacterium]
MKKLLLFLLFICSVQFSISQPSKISKAKFSPLGDIIAYTDGSDRNSNLNLYLMNHDELIKRIIPDSLHNLIVREFEFSPKGDVIAMLLTTKMITDLYVYMIKAKKIIRCTNSSELKNSDLGYKSWLQWCDNQSVIFLSKHSGISQQYIFDFSDMTLKSNGSSKGNEYFLTYSQKSQESYYIAVINNREPSVYRRKRASSINTEISKDGKNHITPILSDKNNFLFYSVMPEISPCIFDLNNSKFIKTKLPKLNVKIVGWSESDSSLACIYSHYDSEENFAKTDFMTYNYFSHKKQIISKEIEPALGILCSPDGTKFVFSKSISPYTVTQNVKKYNTESIQTFISDKKGVILNYPLCGIANDWSNDNKTVLFTDGNNLVLLNVETGKLKSILTEK